MYIGDLHIHSSFSRATSRECDAAHLDRALLLGVETTIQEMEERKLPVHSRTLKARDWLRSHGVTTEEGTE